MSDPVNIQPGDQGCWKAIGVWSKTSHKCPRLEQYTHCHHCPVYAGMARTILGQTLPEDWDSSAVDDGELESVSSHLTEAFVIKLGNTLVAFEPGTIQQVSGFSRIHTIPNRSNPILRGLVNIDGELRICVSLGRLMAIPHQATSADENIRKAIHERLVTIKTLSGYWVIPVSEVIGHQLLNPGEPTQPVDTLAATKYTKSVMLFDDQPVLLLGSAELDQGFLTSTGGANG
ncbi:MAG: chemotaxis protein CheW [bacterium]